MTFLASPQLLLVVLLLTGLAFVVALRMRRERNRILQQATLLAQDVETLNDRLWALADSEERYRSLIEAQGDLIVRRDGGRIVYANAAYAALLGLSEDAAIGSHDEPKLIACRAAQATTDGARVFDECLATPDGERWISWVETIVPVALGASVLQRVGRDISARIDTEQALVEARARAESASEAKSRFIATVSHEFRTPLNGILGMADLLADTRLDPEQSTYVGALRTSGEAMLSLVDDILDVAKVEAGKLELTLAPCDLGQIVETVGELMAPRAQAKGLDLAIHVAPDLPARLLGDRDRLRQILLNLVGNAIKFTQAGGVGIRLARQGDLVEISVSDTGPGIPLDRQAAIFEEFEQADSTATRRHEGTGLGLAIVRRLTSLMQGEITVDSRPGQGARFTLHLPLPATDSLTKTPIPNWHGRSALVMSTAPFTGRFLADMIVATGAEAALVAEPDEAMRSLQAGQGHDAVLIDQSMGPEAVLALAGAAREAGIRERLILLSPTERRQFGVPREQGFTSFLMKPVRARSLYERLSPSPAAVVGGPGSVGDLPSPTASHLPRLRVLVAEDNEINALLVTRTLERLGCSAIWAHNGRQAVEQVTASLNGEVPPFDLVLLDIRMPELDGLSAARAIRAVEAQGKGGSALPLIAVTANVSAEDRAAALSAGMNDCLAKPLSRDGLRRWLTTAEQRSGLSLSA